MNENIFTHAGKGPDTCPRCGGSIGRHPATSRFDNRTPVCSLCGTAEAMIAAGATDAELARVLLQARQIEQEQRPGDYPEGRFE